MFRSFAPLIALVSSSSGVRLDINATQQGAPLVVNLFSNATAAKVGIPELENAFNVAYNHFEKIFDFKVS